MSRFIFRCDSSNLIGSGHIVRCRNIARELVKSGAEVIFICRPQSGDLIRSLDEEFNVLSLPQILPNYNLNDQSLHLSWLGCTQIEDATDCINALLSQDIDTANWLVVDHYSLDSQWENIMLGYFSSKSNCKLLVIDDLANRPHEADLLIDQNFFGSKTQQRYKNLVSTKCKLLLGPSYALIGPEYSQLHSLVPLRMSMNRILIFFGGSDINNGTLKAVKALLSKEFSHIFVDIVLGFKCSSLEEINSLIKDKMNFTLHTALPSLIGLIARADLAIGTGGITTWEKACLDLPSIVISDGENQIGYNKYLHNHRYTYYLGDIDQVNPDQIRQALNYVSSPHFFQPGSQLVDGLGVFRVIHALHDQLSTHGCRVQSANNKYFTKEFLNSYKNHINLNCKCESFKPLSYDSSHNYCVSDLSNLPLFVMRFLNTSLSNALNLVVREEPHYSFNCDNNFSQSLLVQGIFSEHIRNNHKLSSKYIYHCLQSPTQILKSGQLPPSCISILTDQSSWINNYLPKLIFSLWERNHAVRLIHSVDQLCEGDVCFVLSFSSIIKSQFLSLHRFNLVVHESDLPQGKGWSPMSWQILEGNNSIPICLIEASHNVDSGSIYLKDQINLEGHELSSEWRKMQAAKTIELCLRWCDNNNDCIINSKPQYGNSTFYKKRKPDDSMLDVNYTISDQFDLLRIVDNEHYPAYFQHRGQKYKIKIEEC
ncbi:UDP-2,4-diacetamido-2,4,6-trideoxy-beta-L-altropyranose hydrolase [Synechococcus sp. KORDI-100]|uniref:UDP-2,4-diacetamido-2,4, 6-trideoxy-beta-L-altropyranose hydrolase n=1 Tax=Synechococcus sp. KORDI-100 TaxID=1280380 RepID=UPI00138E1005|nr:UDP-2,4-diacetamido-2,4,6-trideoxy-beta-L-altropyranose hydrolase [Synechococcus sp. KORDI-100]